MLSPLISIDWKLGHNATTFFLLQAVFCASSASFMATSYFIQRMNIVPFFQINGNGYCCIRKLKCRCLRLPDVRPVTLGRVLVAFHMVMKLNKKKREFPLVPLLPSVFKGIRFFQMLSNCLRLRFKLYFWFE